MVFPSVPLYLDPSSWNQQHIHQSTIGSGTSDLLSNGGLLRRNSMAERARLAKIPQQELVLKCPRCDSTNTKFCYFNNYSLTQPRHFCKTCRRYWTRGGALRNVPVGGGCRRNNNKRSSSKSTSATSIDKPIAGAPSTSRSKSTAIPSLPLPQPMQFLHPTTEFDTTNIGLGFHGMQPMVEQVDHFHPLPTLNHFPFLGGLESQLMPVPVTGSELASQFASVKMEDTRPRGLSMARQYLDVTRNNQFWDGDLGSGNGGWMADLSGFSSLSTAGNLL